MYLIFLYRDKYNIYDTLHDKHMYVICLSLEVLSMLVLFCDMSHLATKFTDIFNNPCANNIVQMKQTKNSKIIITTTTNDEQ